MVEHIVNNPHVLCMNEKDYADLYDHFNLKVIKPHLVEWRRESHLHAVKVTILDKNPIGDNEMSLTLDVVSAHKDFRTAVRIEFVFYTGVDNICFGGRIEKDAHKEQWDDVMDFIERRFRGTIEEYLHHDMRGI